MKHIALLSELLFPSPRPSPSFAFSYSYVPRRLVRTPRPLHLTEKTLPFFDGYGDYQQYRESVALWDVMTFVDQSPKASTVIGRLSGQAQVIAKTLTIRTLTIAEGLTRLLEEFDKKFGLDKVSLLHDNVSNFFDFV